MWNWVGVPVLKAFAEWTELFALQALPELLACIETVALGALDANIGCAPIGANDANEAEDSLGGLQGALFGAGWNSRELRVEDAASGSLSELCSVSVTSSRIVGITSHIIFTLASGAPSFTLISEILKFYYC